jgi:hypothetical protein
MKTNRIWRWLIGEKGQPIVRERALISKISVCHRCGQVFVNEDDVPNHLCVAADYNATYSFDADTTATCTHQYRDFTIIQEEEKK